MWTPRFWATSYWTGRYWPPGGAPVVPPVHPHAVVLVGTHRTFDMGWANWPGSAATDVQDPPAVGSLPTVASTKQRPSTQVGRSRIMVTSVRSGSTVDVTTEATGPTRTSRRNKVAAASQESATDVEVRDD